MVHRRTHPLSTHSTGNTLSPSRVFTAIALFNQLRFPLLYYPMVRAASMCTLYVCT